MKSDKKQLVDEISALILSNLKGLNEKSAKKLVKTVDKASEEIAKKYEKLQKDEEEAKEKAEKKAAEKIKEQSKKVLETFEKNIMLYSTYIKTAK